MASALREYLSDPFLGELYRHVRQAGPLRSISLDLADTCNLRCRGCYFFAEEMDRSRAPEGSAELEAFIESERARGTNFVTVVGGEPTLHLDRLKTIYDNFHVNVATNGWIRIPYDGFENLPIGISVWGDRETDRTLRGSGRTDVFSRALANYRGDPRAFWYYTVTPGNTREIEPVVRRCIDNGNRVLFNFYGDVEGLGGGLDHRLGFEAASAEIDRMIEAYPEHILMTSYLNRVVATGRLYDERWGYDVCTSVTVDDAVARERAAAGKPWNRHFRAYNADLRTTRRCCTGVDRDCGSCFDTWEHFSWIMLRMKRHLGSKKAFTHWLTTMYLFYWINRIVDFDRGAELLPEIHRRVASPVFDHEVPAL